MRTAAVWPLWSVLLGLSHSAFAGLLHLSVMSYNVGGLDYILQRDAIVASCAVLQACGISLSVIHTVQAALESVPRFQAYAISLPPKPVVCSVACGTDTPLVTQCLFNEISMEDGESGTGSLGAIDYELDDVASDHSICVPDSVHTLDSEESLGEGKVLDASGPLRFDLDDVSHFCECCCSHRCDCFGRQSGEIPTTGCDVIDAIDCDVEYAVGIEAVGGCRSHAVDRGVQAFILPRKPRKGRVNGRAVQTVEKSVEAGVEMTKDAGGEMRLAEVLAGGDSEASPLPPNVQTAEKIVEEESKPSIHSGKTFVATGGPLDDRAGHSVLVPTYVVAESDVTQFAEGLACGDSEESLLQTVEKIVEVEVISTGVAAGAGSDCVPQPVLTTEKKLVEVEGFSAGVAAGADTTVVPQLVRPVVKFADEEVLPVGSLQTVEKTVEVEVIPAGAVSDSNIAEFLCAMGGGKRFETVQNMYGRRLHDADFSVSRARLVARLNVLLSGSKRGHRLLAEIDRQYFKIFGRDSPCAVVFKILAMPSHVLQLAIEFLIGNAGFADLRIVLTACTDTLSVG